MDVGRRIQARPRTALCACEVVLARIGPASNATPTCAPRTKRRPAPGAGRCIPAILRLGPMAWNFVIIVVDSNNATVVVPVQRANLLLPWMGVAQLLVPTAVGCTREAHCIVLRALSGTLQNQRFSFGSVTSASTSRSHNGLSASGAPPKSQRNPMPLWCRLSRGRVVAGREIILVACRAKCAANRQRNLNFSAIAARSSPRAIAPPLSRTKRLTVVVPSSCASRAARTARLSIRVTLD